VQPIRIASYCVILQLQYDRITAELMVAVVEWSRPRRPATITQWNRLNAVFSDKNAMSM